MLAVGAMYAGKLNTNDVPAKRETSMVAFQHYSYAIEGLREAIDGIKLSPGRQGSRSQEEHVCILWTTFLLGLFEVSRAIYIEGTMTAIFNIDPPVSS